MADKILTGASLKSMNDAIKKLAQRKAAIADLDAELNGGVLAEICMVAGKKVYIRVNHNDPEKAQYEVGLVTHILKSVLQPPDEDDDQGSDLAGKSPKGSVKRVKSAHPPHNNTKKGNTNG